MKKIEKEGRTDFEEIKYLLLIVMLIVIFNKIEKDWILPYHN